MTSHVEEHGDEDLDLIQLNFGDNIPRLESLQFLDPGIIELDCDSEDDCVYTHDTADFSIPSTAELHLPLVTPEKSNSLVLKSMHIKLVDCYKFPWYFDKFTKDIIENKLVTINNLNINISGNLMDVIPKEFTNVPDNKCVDDLVNNTGLLIKGIDNNISSQIEVNANECLNECNKNVNKSDMNSTEDMVNTDKNKTDKKRLKNYNKRNDIEIQNAIKQRNITSVDLKKNKGLVGLKVQRIVTEKKIVDVQKKPRKQDNTVKSSNDQDKSNQSYAKAMDEALIDSGTTIMPEEESQKKIHKSRCTSQDLKVDSSGKNLNSLTWNSITPSALENEKKTNYSKKKVPCQRKYSEKKIDDPVKIAEEIVRLAKPSRENIQFDDEINFNKGTHYSNKTKKEHGSRFIDGKQSDKIQKNENEIKMTKLIPPLPLSPKARLREKHESVRQFEDVDLCEVTEQKSPILSNTNLLREHLSNITKESYIMKYFKEKHDSLYIKPSKSTNLNFSDPKPKTNMLKKSFTRLNKLTESILKIKGMHQNWSKMNELDNLKSQQVKKTSSDQSTSINECKSMPSLSLTEVNLKNDLSPEVNNVGSLKQPDETMKDILEISDSSKIAGPKTSIANLPYSNTNHRDVSPNNGKHYLCNHLQFPRHITTNTLPLSTSIVGMVKSAKVKNSKKTGSVHVENTRSHRHNSEKKPKKVADSLFVEINKNGSKELLKQANTTTLNGIANANIQYFESQKSPANNQSAAEKFAIQTIKSSRNESNAKMHKNNDKSIYTHVPKFQASADNRPIEAQNNKTQAVQKPLTVHNSLQAHILYRPQTGNPSQPQTNANNPGAVGFQVPLQQMNQYVYQQTGNNMQYPHSYNEVNPLNCGMPMTPRPLLRDYEMIAPQINTKTIPLGGNGGLSPQTVAMDVKHSGVNRNMSPLVGSNARPMPMESGGVLAPQMIMNSRPPGFNDIVALRSAMNVRPIGSNRGIPTHVATINKPIPPDIGDVHLQQVGSNARPMPIGVVGKLAPQTAINSRSPIVNGIIASQTAMKSGPPIVNGIVAPQSAANLRSSDGNRGIPINLTMNNRPLPPGVCDVYTHQVGSNDKPVPTEFGRILPPQIAMNSRPPSVNAIAAPQTAMNIRPSIGNKGIPEHMNINNRLKPPGVCDVVPGNIVWSYAFPPSIPPPPPPPLPPHPRQLLGFPCNSQVVDSSVIGRNRDGCDIKKINISSPVIAQNTEVVMNERIVKIESFQSDSKPVYDEISTPVSESSETVITKSEMILELDRNILRMESPVGNVDHLMKTLPITPYTISYCSAINASSVQKSIHTPSKINDRPVMISKTTKPQQKNLPMETNSNFKRPPVINNVNQVSKKYIKKCNDFVVSTYNQMPNKELRMSQPTHPEAPYDLSVSSSKITITNQFENSAESVISSKKIDDTSPSHISKLIPEKLKKSLPDKNNNSPVNLKRPHPTSDNKNASTVKYKPGPLSKKKKLTQDAANKSLPNKGYSSPILPIPTYETILLDRPKTYNKFMARAVEKANSVDNIVKIRSSKNSYDSKKQVHEHKNKVDRTKKISLTEYKNRTPSERRDDIAKCCMDKIKTNEVKNSKVDMRRASNVDSDLGYDSDSTVKL